MPYLLTAPRFAATAAPPFSPTDIAGCLLWFDFADTTTITDVAGEVTTVSNKGSATRTLDRPAVGPTTGTATQNGRNVLAFNGSSNALRVSGTGVIQAQPVTLMLVAKYDVINANDHLTDDGDAGARLLLSGNGGSWGIYAGSAVLTGGTSDLLWHTFTVVFDGASSLLRLDGTQIASGNPGTNALGGTWSIGLRDNYTEGKYAELTWHNTALGTTDLQSLESYAKTKWGTP